MMTCEACARAFPEVVGAPTQVCPHCNHEMASAAAHKDAARGTPVDPVGALQLAWRIARAEHVSLLLLWLPAFALELAAAFAVARYSEATAIPEPAAMTTGEQMAFLGVALPLLIAFFTVRIATWTFASARVLDVALGGHRFAQWRALVVPALLAGFVLTLAYTTGIILAFVGFFVLLHWFLYVPVYVAQGVRLGAAFDRSRRFARDRRTHGFTALVSLVLAVVYGTYSALSSTLSGWQADVLPAALLLLAGPVVPLLAASYVALAIREAAPGTRATASEPAKRATTKCPQCGTLIPYAPSASGAAVAIVCPSCGRAGKVL